MQRGDLCWSRGRSNDNEGEEAEGGFVFRYSGGGVFEDVSSSGSFGGEAGAAFSE